MLAQKILIACFLVLLLALPATLAQQLSSPPSVVFPVGLLLAHVIHERNPDAFGDISMVRYETLWIVRDASGAHIAAQLPDIIVPRKSGFWRMGIEHTCQLAPAPKDDSNNRGNISTADFPYAVPVGQPPVVELEFPACDSKTAERFFDDAYNPEFVPDPDSGHPPDPNAPSECGWANRWFGIVLPDLVSVSYFQGVSEVCEPQGGNTYKEIWVQSKKSNANFEEPPIVSVASFDFSGNKLGAKLLDLPPTKIVMAEWATGRFVQSWTESLSVLRSQGLPAATVKLRVASN